MSVIGRNMPCPCMSGKKYKNCCDRTGIWEALKEQGLNYFDESYALDEILKVDPAFKNFYENERFKVNKPIFFVQTHNTRSAASFGNLGDEVYIIASKHSKYPAEDAIYVAHELEHLIFWSKGYKYIMSHNPNTRAHKFINDLIFDPLINNILLKYGFDIPSYLNLSDEIQMKIKPIREDSLLLSTLIVKRCLDYRNLNPKTKIEDTNFYKWVNKNFPSVIPLGYEILKIIEDIGLTSSHNNEVVMLKLDRLN